MPTLSRLLAASALVVASAGAAGAGEHLSTRAYLDMPEIFQVSVVTGSLAMLHHFSCELEKCECFARWTVPDDVVVIVSQHARARPDSLEQSFGTTLVAALADRCAL